MRKNKILSRFTSILIVVMLLCTIITGCGVPKGEDNTVASNSNNSTTTTTTSGKETENSEPKELKFSILTEPEAVDPQNGADTTSKIVRGAIFEGLLCWKDGKISPAAAENYEISDDGLTYTFKIRKDAKWWDGKDLTAQDFVDGTVRLVSPTGPNGSYAYYGYFLENAEAYHKGEINDASKIGVKALDEKTLEFKLIKPVPYFLSINAGGFFLPVRQDIVDKYGKEFVADADKIMGNGPYKIVNWKHEQSLSFEKNQEYWNKDSIKLDKIEMLVISEANTALNMYENDEIDFVNIPPELVEMYNSKNEAIFFENGSERFLEINSESKGAAGKFLANKNFRKALLYALDRQAIVDAVCKDGSVPALRYVPNSMSICGTTWGKKFPKEYISANGDLDKAKEYLQKALDELGTTADQIPPIELLTTDATKSKVMTEALQDVFSKNLGLKIEIKLYQSKQLWPLRAQKEFDMVYIGNVADYNDPNAFLERALSNNNKVNFANEEFDKIFEEASNEVDENKRAELLLKLEEICMEELPFIPIYFDKFAWAKKDYVKNVSREVISDIDPNYIYADIVK